MKNFFFLCFFFLSINSYAAVDIEKLIQAADNIRNPATSFFMKVQVESEGNTSILDVYLKDADKTLIVSREPARDRGRNMLMLDRDFHAYIPNLKRTMRLSLAQKLSGQVANGDIARTRWSGDYEASLLKEDKGNISIRLKAKKNNLTYAFIVLTIEGKTAKPLYAEHLGTDGKTVLKTAYYEDYKNIAGAVRPSTIRIVDPAKKLSFIRVLDMQKKSFEDSFFSIRNMETFK